MASQGLLLVVMAATCISLCLSETITRMQALSLAYNWMAKKAKPTNTATNSTTAKLISTWEINATTPEFVTRNGYPVETHNVTTEDGYLLTVHRIPGSPKASSSGAKTPVLLQHGIFAASDVWVLMGPEKSLGFLLADQGYDVWLGNARGNFYSRNHVTLSPKDPKFWDFTWHEMGVYDLPAVIDHILNTTSQPQLFYVGHSMGTTMFYVLASTRTEYNQKIRLAATMAPAVFLKDIRQKPLKTVANRTSLVYWGLNATGLKRDELFPRFEKIASVVDKSCRAGLLTQFVCLRVYCEATGAAPERVNKTLLPIILAHVFSGSSLNSIIHFFQLSNSDRFQLFDHSVQQGKIMPEYNLSSITVPVSIHYAMNDTSIHPDGVMRLSKLLPNLAQVVRLADDSATHTDFVLADSAKQLVYDDVIAVLKKYQQ